MLDIVPTYYLYTHVTIEFVQAYFHWFHQLRPAPVPENEIKAQNEAAKARATDPHSDRVAADGVDDGEHPRDVRGLPRRRVDRPAARQGGSRQEDRVPAVDVCGASGADGPALRRAGDLERARNEVSGKGLPGGHNLQEGAPAELLAELQRFLSA